MREVACSLSSRTSNTHKHTTIIPVQKVLTRMVSSPEMLMRVFLLVSKKTALSPSFWGRREGRMFFVVFFLETLRRGLEWMGMRWWKRRE
jgi:hypothetical protein